MTRGIDPAKRQQWSERFLRFSSSGLTVAAFCVSESVSVPSFYQWRRKLAPEPVESSSRESSQQRFLAVQIAAAAQLEIHLPNGARVCLSGSDAALVDAAIAAAGRLPNIVRSEEAAC